MAGAGLCHGGSRCEPRKTCRLGCQEIATPNHAAVATRDPRNCNGNQGGGYQRGICYRCCYHFYRRGKRGGGGGVLSVWVNHSAAGGHADSTAYTPTNTLI